MAQPSFREERADKTIVEVSTTKKMRTTILAGDVHCASLARFERTDDSPSTYLWQITTSPVGNVPISWYSFALTKMCELNAAMGSRFFTNALREKCLKWQPGWFTPYSIQRRNWLESTLMTDGKLRAQLIAEIVEKERIHFDSYEMEITPPQSPATP